MEELNSDCLLKIFLELNFLERIALEVVCKKWRRVLQHPCAYSDIEKLDASKFLQASTSNFFQQDTINFEPKMLGILQRCGPSLKDFGFGSRWLKISQPIIESVARYCQQLTRLDLGCIILNADISPILKNVAQRLEYFSLEETSWTNEENAMKVNHYLGKMKNLVRLNLRRFMYNVDEIVGVSYKLEVVDLSGTKRLSLEVLSDFLNSHGNLKEVTVCPFPYFNYQHSAPPTTKKSGLEGEDPERLQTAIDSVGKLQKLSTLSIGYMQKRLLNMSPLAELENLRVLHIQECNCITGWSLKHVLEATTHLRILSLINCPMVDDFSCLAICPALSELEVRRSTHISDGDLEKLARNGVLKRLRLELCLNVSNKSICTLAALCPLIEDQILEFSLEGKVISVFTKPPNVKVELSKCENIEEELFKQPVLWGQLNLQILSLNGTKAITNQSLVQLADSGLLKQLRELDISHNKNVDDSSMRCLHSKLASKGQSGVAGKKQRSLIIYVFQTGVTRQIKREVHEHIELVF